jgi:ribulose-phosphate 3-epimerase
MTRQVAPSILAADFGRLREQVDEVVAAGARVIHVDIMDGHFVPPLSMGPGAVEALRDLDVILDVHLMIERPERQVEAFAKAGANHITIHAEATPHVHYALGAIRDAGCQAGLAICPATPIDIVLEAEEMVDLALVMTVNPGWGGQPFITTSPDKVRRLRERAGPELAIEVDGGIDVRTAASVTEAGATHLVAGSAVFGAADPAGAYRAIAAASSAVATQ